MCNETFLHLSLCNKKEHRQTEPNFQLSYRFRLNSVDKSSLVFHSVYIIYLPTDDSPDT